MATTLWLVMTVWMAAPVAPVDVLVQQALEHAATADTRYRVGPVRSTAPRGCSVQQASLQGPVRGSGRVALALSGVDHKGRSCGGLAWTQVTQLRLAHVLRDAAALGDPVAAHVERQWVEMKGSGEPWMGAVEGLEFAQPVASGEVLEERQVRLLLPKPGTPVNVMVRQGAITVTHRGWLVRCGPRRACAQVGSGRQVSGVFSNGTLWVEEP